SPPPNVSANRSRPGHDKSDRGHPKPVTLEGISQRSEGVRPSALFRLDAFDADDAGGRVFAFHLFKPGPDVLGPSLARGGFVRIHSDQHTVGEFTAADDNLGLFIAAGDHLAAARLDGLAHLVDAA